MRMVELAPHSGEDAVCPKCSYGSVSMEYQSVGTKLATPTGAVVFSIGAPEWMLRRCAVCGYCWAEEIAGGS